MHVALSITDRTTRGLVLNVMLTTSDLTLSSSSSSPWSIIHAHEKSRAGVTMIEYCVVCCNAQETWTAILYCMTLVTLMLGMQTCVESRNIQRYTAHA